MDLRNRIGLYGAYFCGMAGIGFTLPYLPLYLGQEGMSDRGIGLVSTLAAIGGLAQFPVGLWSDRIGTRKPFLVACLTLIALSTLLLRWAHGPVWLGLLVIIFAENGICRAIVESLSGAEATSLARADEVGPHWARFDSGNQSASSSSPWWGAGWPKPMGWVRSSYPSP